MMVSAVSRFPGRWVAIAAAFGLCIRDLDIGLAPPGVGGSRGFFSNLSGRCKEVVAVAGHDMDQHIRDAAQPVYLKISVTSASAVATVASLRCLTMVRTNARSGQPRYQGAIRRSKAVRALASPQRTKRA